MVHRAGVAEHIAASLLQQEECDLETLEALMSLQGFNFGLHLTRDSKTVFQLAVQRNDLKLVELVYRWQTNAHPTPIHVDDMRSINLDQDSKSVLSFLLERAEQKTIKKCITTQAYEWMTPKTAWLLMELEGALKTKLKGSFFDLFNKKELKDGIFISAVQCKSVNPKWIEDMLKTEFVKYAKPRNWYSAATGHGTSESALVCALLQKDFVLAKEILDAGYQINRIDAFNELESAIRNNATAKAIEFLISNGCYPFPQKNWSGKEQKLIRGEEDVEQELKKISGGIVNDPRIMNFDEFLLIAMKNGNQEVVDVLLKNGNSMERLLKYVAPVDRSLVENELLKRMNTEGSLKRNDRCAL